MMIALLKRLLRQTQQTHRRLSWQRAMKIKEKNRFFNALYQDSNGFLISQAARHDDNRFSLIYGEVVFESFAAMLSIIKSSARDVFYDLGSGTGKACLAAAIAYDLKRCVGIELLAGLHNEALRIKEKLTPSIKNKLSFIHSDFTQIDISTASIVFINGSGFFGDDWQNIVVFLIKNIKKDCRLIITSKSLPKEQFALQRKTTCLMSWGVAEVTLYIRRG